VRRSLPRGVAAALLAVAAIAACSSATTETGPELAPGTGVVSAKADAGELRSIVRPISDADVEFMSGMIPHHAQAIRMSSWAESHGASNAVRILSARIINAQVDEIRLMQDWLRQHGKPVPDSNATHHKMTMAGGMQHDMLMPGMLTDEEMAQLDRARDREFDRLFLTFMIKHHAGAVSMVEKLMGSYGAAQDDFVYKMASDVFADQTTEIDRMQRMLDAMQSGRGLQENFVPSPRP